MKRIVIIFILSGVFLFTLSQAAEIPGDWGYRKSHRVNYLNGAGPNYQVWIRVYKGDGTSGGDSVFLHDHCRDDFGDVRFTGEDSVSQLDYFVADSVHGQWADFLLEVACNLSADSCDIFLYYGNPDSTTTSNLSATALEVGDDFEYEDSINAHGWIIDLGPADSIHTTTEKYKHGARSCKAHGIHDVRRAQKKLIADRYKIVTWFYDDDDGTAKNYNYASEDSDFSRKIIVGYNTNESGDYYVYHDTMWHTTSVARAVGWHKVQWRFCDDSCRGSIDGETIFSQDTMAGYCRWIRIYGGGYGESYHDTWMALKCAYAEPTQGDWGEEEGFWGPTPNPMTWDTVPHDTSGVAISMEATTASDVDTPINYYFDYVSSPTGGSGGTDGAWQRDTIYTDSGLDTNHQYGYAVRARDSLENEGWPSDTEYAYTAIQTPSGITFGTITDSSIQLKSTNTPSGLDRGNSGLRISNVTNSYISRWIQGNDYFTNRWTGQIDSFPFLWRTSVDKRAAQGVATDGSCFYTTAGTDDQMHDWLFKWDKDWSLLDSEYVADDSPVGKTQVNHICLRGGKLYIGANNYGAKSKIPKILLDDYQESKKDSKLEGDTSWIVVYSASDLSYDTFYVVLTGYNSGEGCAFYDSAFWCVFGTYQYCRKYDFTWESYNDYALDYTTGMGSSPAYNGAIWVPPYFYCNIHESRAADYVDCYEWNGSGFDTVARIPRPTEWCSQGLCLDPDTQYVWFAERCYDDSIHDHRVVKTSIRWFTGADTLEPNIQYTYKIQARNGDGDTTAWCDTVKKYTAAAIPSAPTVGDSTRYTILVDVEPGGNPVATEFAIRDSVRQVWIKADGDSQSTAVWQTNAQWDTTRVIGLSSNTTYNFYVKAKNGDALETVFGTVGSGKTGSSHRILVVD